jgi:hypothetical protein
MAPPVEQREQDRGGDRADDGLRGKAHEPQEIQHRAPIADVERGLGALEPEIGERAFRTLLGGARQDRLELMFWHADETVLGPLGCHGVPPCLLAMVLDRGCGREPVCRWSGGDSNPRFGER